MSNNFFRQKIILERGGRIVQELNARDLNGNPVWYLLSLSPAEEQELLHQLSRQEKSLDLAKIGQIIAFGNGTAPDDLTRQKIIAEHKLLQS